MNCQALNAKCVDRQERCSEAEYELLAQCIEKDQAPAMMTIHGCSSWFDKWDGNACALDQNKALMVGGGAFFFFLMLMMAVKR